MHRLGLAPAQLLLVVVFVATAGALGGFLAQDRPPARVFMGDGGALFIGALPAAVAVVLTGSPAGGGGVPLIVVVLLLSRLLWDATLTMIFRFAKREDWLRPHRRQLFQRLVSSGWSHGRVRRLYFAICALGCAGGLAWLVGPPVLRVASAFGVMPGSTWLSCYVGRAERVAAR